ncbi:MltA-interacting MipA [Rhodovulum sp. PH10]|uniref:MipA/OmpV family protein n=1 Tax=Rhodovulum sp. PH10 TaxID=1187851 RepID=UPI00027C2112|nr:MipA/OmpV family protein [Rhodovulum sp. PH10]EJW09362.1 MltA-interacting MipA [Rhodovulum sp. PH10]
MSEQKRFGAAKIAASVAGLALGTVLSAGVAGAADLGAYPGNYGAYKAPVAAPAWVVTLGVEGMVEPEFLGSDDFTVRPAPIFSFRRAGTPEKFRSPNDNISFAVIDLGGFELGPVGKLVSSRKESDSHALYGLGDVGWTVELGGYVQYWWTPWLRTRAEVRQGIGGHSGVVADITGDVVVPVTPQLTLSGGPRVQLATAKANDPYFSIDPWHSFISGLPTYDAGGGVRSVGAGAQARYFWTPTFATHVYVEYAHLMDDVADSPLVTYRGSEDQITVGVGFTQAFTIQQFW